MIASTPSIAIVVPTLTCGRCKYTWQPRQSRAPKRCPSCGTPEWWLGGANSAARLPAIRGRLELT